MTPHDSTHEPEFTAIAVVSHMAAALGHAEESYRRGTAAPSAIRDALTRHGTPNTIASACRIAWAAMVGRASAPSRFPANGVERRDVEVAELLDRLRSMLGVMPEHTADGERVAAMGLAIPEVVQGLDVAAWLGWSLVGLMLFSGTHPSMTELRDEARRYGVALAMLRCNGNLSAVERLTGSMRPRIRWMLRRAGLYPWPG